MACHRVSPVNTCPQLACLGSLHGQRFPEKKREQICVLNIVHIYTHGHLNLKQVASRTCHSAGAVFAK